jgi:caffeoyl-CoA O-methyltransferase
MSIKSTGLREDLLKYLLENFSGEDEFLLNLKNESEKAGIPQISISPEQVLFMQFIIKSINAKFALEIGTLAGYSGISIARALPSDGKLITIETNTERAAFAKQKFLEAGLDGKIQVINSDGLAYLEEFSPNLPLDFVFLDADKQNYSRYFEKLDKFLRVGGIFAADNAFGFGYIAAGNPPEDDIKDVEGIRSFTQLIKKNKNYLTVIAPVGDGLLLALKIS